MARILALSSWIAHGHVGLGAIAPVLQILGHNVTQLPTVQLSNHPGFKNVAGVVTEPETLRAIVAALDENGFLKGVETILTGYLPSAAHVEVAVELIDRFENSRPRVIVDPVLGDFPKGLYIAQEAAETLLERLVPKADILTPNLFELSWLTKRIVPTVSAAIEAAQDLGTRAPGAEILITSAPFENAQTGLLDVKPSEIAAFRTSRAPADHSVPHGVGDVFSAMISAGLPAGRALGCLQRLIEHSLDAQHLRIVETAALWTTANAIDPTPLTGSSEMR